MSDEWKNPLHDIWFTEEVRKMSNSVNALELTVRKLTSMLKKEEEKMDKFIIDWKDEVSQKAFEIACDDIEHWDISCK